MIIGRETTVLSRVRGRETSMVQGRDARLDSCGLQTQSTIRCLFRQTKERRESPKLSREGRKRLETATAGAVNANE